MEGRSCWGVEDIVQKEVEVHLWGNLRQPNNTSHPTPGVVPGDPGLPACVASLASSSTPSPERSAQKSAELIAGPGKIC